MADLSLPQLPEVPEPKPDDPEDVSWALSTAEAMWARGDHAEGIKWVRRAAEAASEAERDGRALELAKAAADLQGLIARMSIADKGSDRAVSPGGRPSAAPSVPPKGRSVPPARTSAAPPARTSVTPGRPSAPPATPRSIPPIGRSGPASTRTSVAPAVPSPASTTKPSAPPKPESAKPESAPKTTPTGRSVPPVAATASKPPPASKDPGKEKEKKKSGRKSRENLAAEAKAAGVLTASAQIPVTSDTDEIAVLSMEDAIPLRKKPPPASDPTMVAAKGDIEKNQKKTRSTVEWDSSPTANVTGEVIELDDLDRKTKVGAPPLPTTTTQRNPPASVPPRASPSRAPVPHDQSIQTSQAIRVVVWRDANGVHVAPAGTVVSALKIDAMLVALEPTSDLTAWLSPKTR